MRKRKCTIEEVIEAVKTSFTISEVLRKLGYVATTGGNYLTIRRVIKENGIDTSHFKGSGWAAGKSSHNARPLEEYLTENSHYHTSLKEKIVRAGLLVNACHVCGIPPEWNGKTLKLQMDHKNGNKFDNRIENLRLICPNCHSQTPTFCRTTVDNGQVAQMVEARRLERRKCEFESRLGHHIVCSVCKKSFVSNSSRKRKYCSVECARFFNRKVVERPSKEALKNEIENGSSWAALAKKYGVSDTTVRKWAR
jgi:hypothetical protein